MYTHFEKMFGTLLLLISLKLRSNYKQSFIFCLHFNLFFTNHFKAIYFLRYRAFPSILSTDELLKL